jgi:serine/threonine-protein kinase
VYALTLCLIEGITGKVPFAGDSTVSTLAARVDKLMPVTADMGSLASVLERGGRPDPDDRWTAEQFAGALAGAAGSLPRPAPIPVLASGLFTPAAAAPEPAAQVEPVAEPAVEIDDAVVDDALVAPPVTAQMPASEVDAALMATVPPTTQVSTVDPTPSGILYDDERSSRRWGRILAIGAVVIAGLAALGVVLFLLLRTKSYEVPDLVGIDEAVALNEISGNGWVIETERERSDEVPEVDHVVRTIPAAGEQLDEGETFVMVVSDGPELRAIPELAGLTLADARAALDELRLVLVEGEPAFSETVPAGSVISWQVEGNASLVAGAQVLPDTVIGVTVSLGPEPRPAPDLTNQTIDEATAALGAVQLVIARAEDEFSSTIEVGRIVTQDPPPGTPVARDGTVTVRVSKGPDLVPIPDLTGQTYPQAQQTLADAGFVIENLLGTTQGTFVSIEVGGTEVAAGATFPRGTAVDLVFL